VIKYVLGCLTNRRNKTVDNTVNKRVYPSKTLLGWEASEIVRERGTKILYHRKEVKVNGFGWKSAPTWWELAKDKDFLVLFSQELGPLIWPAANTETCVLWTGVPEKSNFLATSIPCLVKRAKKRGLNRTTPFRLTDDLGWTPSPPI
jgi:hypothetical protein